MDKFNHTINNENWESHYRNIIAGLPHGERIFFFEKNKVRLSKTEFLNFYFFSKKSSKWP